MPKEDLAASAKETAPVQFSIVGANYLTSACELQELPSLGVGEIAFVGRSNAGKSSLLNALTGRKNLARASKTPGRTQMLNFFEVNILKKEGERKESLPVYFVDLPGFGYAEVSKSKKKHWQKLLEGYLFSREELAAVVLVVDGRRTPGKEERWISELGERGGLFTAMTKIDKLKQSERAKQKQALCRNLSLPPEQVFPVSLLPSKIRGVTLLRDKLAELVFG